MLIKSKSKRKNFSKIQTKPMVFPPAAPAKITPTTKIISQQAPTSKILTREEILDLIDRKTQELEEVKIKLKKDFVGIDHIIDQIIENMKVWYIFPDLQIRPTIMCLWGTTGVGKTDLVRKLVSYLNIQDKFLEIEMRMGNDKKTIQDELSKLENATNEPAILLLDEFQNFRTIDDGGADIQGNLDWKDIWILLSDGKFQNNISRRQQMLDEILNNRYYAEFYIDDSPEKDLNTSDAPTGQGGKKEKPKEKIYKSSVWSARAVKRMLRLSEPLEEIMKWSQEEIITLYYKNLNNKSLCEGEDYRKLLVIISGNLDEAYTMADDLDDVEVDADIYHEFSKKVNIIHIKSALKERFKPEQIARLGNNHITYHCLNKASYYSIIKKKCAELSTNLLEKHNVDFIFDTSIYELIYKNGVFPTQGVRPVLSTFTNIMGSIVPEIIYNAIKTGCNRAFIRSDGKVIISNVNGVETNHVVNLEIEKIKNQISDDKIALVASHELGHALSYALLFGTPPSQININSTSIFNQGFVFKHTVSTNKDNIKKQIIINLAGQLAEEMVFGEKEVSAGSQHDLISATTLASSYVRRYGFDGYVGVILNENRDGNEMLCGYKESSKNVEDLLKECRAECVNLLSTNKALYRECLMVLINNRTMSQQEMCDIAKKHGVEMKAVGAEVEIISDYRTRLTNFLNG